MGDENFPQQLTFGQRLALAWKVLFKVDFAVNVAAGLGLLEASRAAKPSPEKEHASALVLLASLQREGRLIDFLQQDVATFSDEEVGAAARVVHSGCTKALSQYFKFDPAAKEPEGTTLSLPAGFDAQKYRLSGNVTGQPPFRGTLKHHGWIASEIKMPKLSESVDPKVVAPAEVELP